jgi:hypothetical protein
MEYTIVVLGSLPVVTRLFCSLTGLLSSIMQEFPATLLLYVIRHADNAYLTVIH